MECTYSRRRKGEFVLPLDVKSHYNRDLFVVRRNARGKYRLCVSSIWANLAFKGERILREIVQITLSV